MHPESVDAFLDEAQKRAMRMNGGKALMDRHAPGMDADVIVLDLK